VTKGGEALAEIDSGSVTPRWRVLRTCSNGEQLVADQRGRILRLLPSGSWWVVSPPRRGSRPRGAKSCWRKGAKPCWKSLRNR